MTDLLQLLLLAIAGAFYPTLLAIVVIVLSRPSPARVLAYFLAGAAFVSITIGLVAVLFLDTASFGGSRRTFSAGVDLAVGILAFVGGATLYRRQPAPKTPRAEKAPSGPSFSQRMLSHDSGWIIFSLGVVLDLPGLWYVIGLKEIMLGGYSTTAEITLVVAFNIVMFTFVEVPLVAFLLSPEKTTLVIHRFNDWLRVNVRHIVALLVLGLGTWLIVRGIAALV